MTKVKRSSNRLYAYRGVLASGTAMAAVFAAAMLLLFHYKHIETLKVVAGACVTLISTMIGASVAFAFARSQMKEQAVLNREGFLEQQALGIAHQRQELAFEMHREFSSAEMLKARTEASKLLESNPGKSYGEIYTKLPEEQTRSLFLVSDFYGRLALAAKHERVDLTLVPELFGAYFVWWWIDVFAEKIVAADPAWPESVRLKWLHDWIARASDPADYKIWSLRAVLGTRPQQDSVAV